MRNSIKFILFALLVLLIGINACAIPAPEYAITATPVPPTPTALSLTLEPNMCLEFIQTAALYETATGGVRYISDASISKGTKFIYMGSKVGDRLFVTFGSREGWILANYVKPCE